MRAVIYCRVSMDKRDRASVQQQEDEARLAATALGWTVVEVLADNDVSASRHARKERQFYPALLELIRGGNVDVVIFWESSRGDRELERWAGLLNLCRNQGVKIHICTHDRTYDLDNARDWKTLAEDGVNNAYASEETRTRVLRAVRSQAAKGLPHGKLAYGYVRRYDERGRFLEQIEEPEQAAIIRDCARRVAAGESLYSIAQDLNARGIPAPRGGTWMPGQIKRLVTNPRYIGQRVHQGVVVGPAVWAAILDEDVFTECVRRMADPRRYTTRDRSLKYLLTGILHCAECGARCRVIKNRGYHAYACFERFCVSVRTVKVEDFVVEMVVERLEQPDILAGLAARADRQAAGATGEASGLQARLEGFYEAAARGEISPAALATIEARILPQIDEAIARAYQAPLPRLVRAAAGPDARQRWERLDLGQKREIIEKLADLQVSATVRGSRFSYLRLGKSRWRGDELTWAERWAPAGVE